MEEKHRSLSHQKVTIEDLPDEVLEFILGFLPPYRDLQNCMSVCRRWYSCGQNVLRKTTKKLIKAVEEFNILWKKVLPPSTFPNISKRFSHAACVFQNGMYIFGGCTTNATSFNDLWKFDLSTRKWVRPIATGTYPAPKAYSSMVHYKDCLVVFGGWTYPSSSQYYQQAAMFNELHFYSVNTFKWVLMDTTNPPPAMAGHSASIQGNEMVVFGGLVMSTAQNNHFQCSNDVWVLDIPTLVWRKQATTKPRPSPRYAQSQIQLDSETLMFLGGVQTHQNRFVYSDCWMLIMKGSVWTWKELTVKNKKWSAANIWCNPACRVGDKVVCLSRTKVVWHDIKPLVTSAVRLSAFNRPAVSVRVEQSLQKPIDRDQNVNGRRGVLPRVAIPARASSDNVSTAPEPGPSSQNNFSGAVDAVAGPSCEERCVNNAFDLGKRDLAAKRNKIERKNKGQKIVRQLQEANKYRMAAFACDTASNEPAEYDLVNQRQIAHLENRPEPMNIEENPPERPHINLRKVKRNTLMMHCLDISTVLGDNSFDFVTWLCPELGEVSGAPEELVMYSLVAGNGEIIMFGGVHNDINFVDYREKLDRYSNALYFITPPRDVI